MKSLFIPIDKRSGLVVVKKPKEVVKKSYRKLYPLKVKSFDDMKEDED